MSDLPLEVRPGTPGHRDAHQKIHAHLNRLVAEPTVARVPKRWYGQGPPGTIIGSAPGDEYVDSLTGDLYTLE